jgi:hypothetical protein
MTRHRGREGGKMMPGILKAGLTEPRETHMLIAVLNSSCQTIVSYYRRL